MRSRLCSFFLIDPFDGERVVAFVKQLLHRFIQGRMNEFRRDFGQWGKRKTTKWNVRMRYLKRFVVKDHISVEKDIDIDDALSPLLQAPSTHAGLRFQARFQQIIR